MPRLEGKVALISGGARGQGAAEAILFAREGAKVVIGDILDDEGRQIEAQIAELGGDATYVHLDVTSADDWDAAVQTALDRYGRLDILVNNAGILGGRTGLGGHHLGAVGHRARHQRQGRLPRHEGSHTRPARGRRRLHREHIVHRRASSATQDRHPRLPGEQGRSPPPHQVHRHPARTPTTSAATPSTPA